jgi:hypothetical protein
MVGGCGLGGVQAGPAFASGIPASSNGCSQLVSNSEAGQILNEQVEVTYATNPTAQEVSCFWKPATPNDTEILVDFNNSSDATEANAESSSTASPAPGIGNQATYAQNGEFLFVLDGKQNFSVSINGSASNAGSLAQIAQLVVKRLPSN